MNAHTGQCPNCKVQVSVDPMALAIKASRLQCWWCGYVEDIAAYELSQPGIPPEAKQLWTLIGAGAIIVGLISFANYLDRMA
jgi:hypothetical protein